MRRGLSAGLSVVGLLVMAAAGALMLQGGSRAIDYPSVAATDSSQVIAFWRERVERDRADFVGFTKLGGAYIRQARETGDVGAYARAEQALRRALEVRPNHSDASARSPDARIAV